MTAGQYLFGFAGRINRAKWWLLILIQIGASIVYYTAMAMLVGTSAFSAMTGDMSGVGSGIILGVLLWLAYAVLMFIWWLAVTVKRLHDRDKSGAWIWLFAVGPWVCWTLSFAALATRSGGFASLMGLAGLGISVWAFVELGCLRGTIGPNRFGPDPLALLYQSAAPVQPA
jgi:uncharacterized membrane protein YhaH (DUF805 family)